jgi:hypothetical protein
MRPAGSAKVLEARRRTALALVRNRVPFNAPARHLSCAPSSGMRWARVMELEGEVALLVSSTPGCPRRLSPR